MLQVLFTATPVLLPLFLTALAGLSTTLGAAICFVIPASSDALLASCLGMSAGVLLYISFLEIQPKALTAFQEYCATTSTGYSASVLTFASIFLGIALTLLLDAAIAYIQSQEGAGEESRDLQKTGTVTSIAMGTHNIIEGMCTFIAALSDTRVGVKMAFAIAFHNVIEGLCISIPVYFASKSRARALLVTFVSGIAEPVGGLIAWILLKDLLKDPGMMGAQYATIAGIMIGIAVTELLPSAYAKDPRDEYASKSCLFGMFLMGFSLILFDLTA